MSRRKRRRSRSRGRRVTHAQRLLGVLLLGVAGVGVWLGWLLASSHMHLLRAELFLDDWTASGEPPSPAAAAAAEAAITTAIARFPVEHAGLHEVHGRILSWQTWSAPHGDPAVEPIRRAALDAYRQATATRPHWAFNWLGIARIKVELLEFDSELDNALWYALHGAPWRTTPLTELARHGLIAWPLLDEAGRVATLAAATRVAALSRRHARDLEPWIDASAGIAAVRRVAGGNLAAPDARAMICHELQLQGIAGGNGLCPAAS